VADVKTAEKGVAAGVDEGFEMLGAWSEGGARKMSVGGAKFNKEGFLEGEEVAEDLDQPGFTAEDHAKIVTRVAALYRHRGDEDPSADGAERAVDKLGQNTVEEADELIAPARTGVAHGGRAGADGG
jgi:hypothetical protein